MNSFSTGRVYNGPQVIEYIAHTQDGVDGIAFRDRSRFMRGFIPIPADSRHCFIVEAYDNGNYTHLNNHWEVKFPEE